MIVISMWGILTRKKKYAASVEHTTHLARVLSTADLTALGIGSTLGVGVYVIAGQVARETAGPAVIISFLIAAIASILSGLCYAEFGARIPRAGSAYIYSYVTVGEMVAFVIGWNLILEYAIGAASVAKGISLYIDSLAADILKTAFEEVAPIKVSVLSNYFDFFAFGLAILLSVALAFGLKESTRMNNAATVVNVCVVLFIIIAGAIKSDINNWKVPANATLPETGDGGFLPFGVSGMLKGAATCFYAFVGFDCIATTAEEVKNPKRAIPFAIIGSQITIFIGYFCTSTVLTLMVPYYLQDINAPFPHAFHYVGWDSVKWIVAIGGICGLFTSLFGSMLPLPRILYALASDGLIFKCFGKINSRFSTPIIGTLIAGLITGLIAAVFDLAQLVNMMSIGTLLAYTLVSTCVLILRYRDAYSYDEETSTKRSSKLAQLLNEPKPSFTNKISNGFRHIFNMNNENEPTRQSQQISLVYILIYSALAFIMALLLFLLYSHLMDGKLYIIVLVSVIGGLMILFLILLSFQPTTGEVLSFKVPFVPVLPAFSILINIYLMLMLDAQTWIRFGIWMFIGIPMYLLCVGKCRKQSKPHSQSPQILQPCNNDKSQKNSGIILDEDSFCQSEEKPPSEDSGIARSMENIRANVFCDEDSILKVDEDNIKKGNAIMVSHDEIKENGMIKEERILKSRNSITSIEDALATLDDAIPYDDDTNFMISNTFNDLDEKSNRFSFGNVSNASSVILVKEDVIALVHREDTRSVPTTPIFEIATAPPLEVENYLESDDTDITAVSNQNKSQEQSPQPSIILSDEVGGEETDTDILEIEVFSIPPAPAFEDFERYNAPLIPRISAVPKETPKPDYEVENENFATTALEQNIPPPPPPSLIGFEMYKAPIIPKVKTSVPLTPKAYSRKSSISRSSSAEEVREDVLEDNVKFGDKQHLVFKDKLNQLLMTKMTTQTPQTKLTKPKDYPVEDAISGSKTLKPVMSKIISEINRNSKDVNYEANQQDIINDDNTEKLVDESCQTSGNIRNRLDALLRSRRINPINMSPSKSRKSLIIDNVQSAEADNINDVHNELPDKTTEGDDTENLADESSQTHGDIKNKLDALFRTTRVNPMSLSPNKSRIALITDNQNQTDNTKDVESHKLKMMGTLKSINTMGVDKDI